jgi:hypothetical protein
MEMTTPVFSAPRSTSGTNSSGASMQFVIEKKMGGVWDTCSRPKCLDRQASGVACSNNAALCPELASAL